MLLKRVRMISILLLFLILTAGCSGGGKVEVRQKKASAASTSSEMSKIYVYICGQVKHPGVYKFPKDARIVSAVEAAGGLTSRAAPDSINQAEKMKDGQQIYVPSKKETSQKNSSKKGTGSETGKININTAGKEELMSLPGIGEAKAQSIIAYREEHGPFSNTEDIMKIQGIKEGIYNKLKDNITI